MFNSDAVIQEGKNKGLRITKGPFGVLVINLPDGDTFIPRDATDLQQFVSSYRARDEAAPIDATVANQVLDRTPRA
jgi:hypothetical protein